MKTLADIVKIERRFARSARLDADLKGTPPLVGYVLQGSVAKSLTAMAQAQSDSRHGAFTWTGPYGGGKSSAALLLANLVAGQTEGRSLARKIVGVELTRQFGKAFPETTGPWAVIPVTGSRVDLRGAIVDAAAKSLSWSPKLQERARSNNGELILALTAAASHKRSGILLVIDELGKFLEHAVVAGGDIHLLQDLGERSSRSEGRLVTLGILHQSFDQYAARLERQTRQEWAKVQGRFQDISFLSAADETVGLLGRALTTKDRPPQALTNAKKVADAVAKRRPTDPTALREALVKTWPLNPVTALLLGPVSRQRFAQNERSVFGFLASPEPYGFLEFLAKSPRGENIDYSPDRLWEYLAANFGMALVAGNDSHKFSLAFDAIDRATAKGEASHVAVTKCAAVIELFRNGSGLAVCDEVLESALPSLGKTRVRKVIQDLVEWAILIRQPRLGGYAMFAGSDFDLDTALAKATAPVGSIEFASLPKSIGVGSVSAKRHYFATGVLRSFDVVLHSIDPGQAANDAAHSIAKLPRVGAGLLVLAVTERDQPEVALNRDASQLSKCLKGFGVPSAVAVISNDFKMREIAAELNAIEIVSRDHAQLQGDQIARREISARRSAALNRIEDNLRVALEDSAWWLGDSEKIATRGSASSIASRLADTAYNQTPVLKSELVQREKPSSSAMAAVRELLYAMVLSADKANLGIVGFPAEMGLYLTVLKPFGLHRELADGVFGFKAPNKTEVGKTLRSAWSVIEEAPSIALNELFDIWESAPYGIKSGVMPILAMASVLSRRDRLACYVDDVFQPAITPLLVDRLLQSPGAIRLRKIDRSVKEAGFLSALSEFLAIPGEPAALPIARALFQRFQSLCDFAKRTDRLTANSKIIRNAILKSDDPEKLLFDTLLKLEIDDVAKAVMVAIDECEGAYQALLAVLRAALARILGVNSATFEGVSARAGVVQGLTNDLRFDAFALRLATFEAGEGEIEGLASLLAHKPPRSWSDRDAENALLDIARFGRRFREAEALAVVRERKSGTEALALVVGLDPKVPALLTSFELTKVEKSLAVALAEKILKSIDKEAGPIRLAALARAVAGLVSEIKLEPV